MVSARYGHAIKVKTNYSIPCLLFGWNRLGQGYKVCAMTYSALKALNYYRRWWEGHGVLNEVDGRSNSYHSRRLARESIRERGQTTHV